MGNSESLQTFDKNEKIFTNFLSEVPIFESDSLEYVDFIIANKKRDFSHINVFKKKLFDEYLENTDSQMFSKIIFFDLFTKYKNEKTNSLEILLALLLLTNSEATIFESALKKLLIFFERNPTTNELLYTEYTDIKEVKEINSNLLLKSCQIALELVSSSVISCLAMTAESNSEFDEQNTLIYNEKNIKLAIQNHLTYYDYNEDNGERTIKEKIPINHFVAHKYPFFKSDGDLRELIRSEYNKKKDNSELTTKQLKSLETNKITKLLFEKEQSILMKRKEEKRMKKNKTGDIKVDS